MNLKRWRKWHREVTTLELALNVLGVLFAAVILWVLITT